MTKYKEFMRAHGTKLECDFDCLPYKGCESIETKVMDSCIVAIAYFNSTEPQYVVYDRYGEHDWYITCDDAYFIEQFNCDPVYDAYVEDKCYALPGSIYDTVVKAMKDMYINDTKVKTAYKHMRAGIMSDLAFTKLLVKYCQKITAIELTIEE